MTFEDGFAAIASIQSSGGRLTDAIARLEELEERLARLDKSQVKLDALLVATKASVTDMASAAKVLAAEHEKLVKWTSDLPALVSDVVEKKMISIASDLESRFTNRLRDELSDTRSTLRNAYENGVTKSEKTLLETKEDLIAEMPRGLFGRRGRGKSQSSRLR